MDTQLSSLTISEAHVARIHECLERMQDELNVTLLMLLDHSGQIIASHRRTSGLEETAVGALLAGTFASSRELARVLKENDFRTLIQQGPRESIYAESVQQQWILAVIFRKQTLLGLVKVMSKVAVTELEKILQDAKLASRDRDRAVGSLMRTSLDSMSDTIDMLFKNLETGDAPVADPFRA